MSKGNIHHEHVDSGNKEKKSPSDNRIASGVDSRRNADPPPDYLNRPEIKVYKDKIFRNGNQQSEIRLQIEIIHDGDPRPMSATERNSIRLIKYGSSVPSDAGRHAGVIPLRPVDDKSMEGWTTQESYNGFLPHPAAQPYEPLEFPLPDTKPNVGEIVDLFIACDSTGQPHPMHIAFLITLDNGRTFRTDGYIFEADGTKGGYGGEIDTGSVHNIYSESAERYTPAQYVMEPREIDVALYAANLGKARANAKTKVKIEMEGEARVDVRIEAKGDAKVEVDVDDVYAQVTINTGRGGLPLGIHSVLDASPSGVMHYMDTRPNTSNPCFTAYVPPGGVVLHHNETILQRLREKNKDFPLTPPSKTGQVLTLAFFLRSGWPRPDFADLPGGRVSFNVIDRYGSPQTIQYEFVNGYRAYIRFV
ncbi:hypothetical protein KCV01_g3143, partial [Aureobasidium melanogenum]